MTDPNTHEQLEQERQLIDEECEKHYDATGTFPHDWRDAAHQEIIDQLNNLKQCQHHAFAALKITWLSAVPK